MTWRICRTMYTNPFKPEELIYLTTMPIVIYKPRIRSREQDQTPADLMIQVRSFQGLCVANDGHDSHCAINHQRSSLTETVGLFSCEKHNFPNDEFLHNLMVARCKTGNWG